MRLLRGSLGLTAVDLVVAAALMGLVATAAGPAAFNALSAVSATQQVVATQGWSNTARWYSEDVANATATNLVDGGAPVSSLTLQWTDSDGVAHTSTYSLLDDTLLRSYDGVSHPMAQQVVSVAFSLAGDVVTATLEVAGGDGATGFIYLTSLMRTGGSPGP